MSIYRLARFTLLMSALVLLPLACGDSDDGGSTGPAATGSLNVSLTMSGPSPDADGCLFTVDGSETRRLLGGESTTYTDLSVGQHEVVISNVAGNCEVLGDASRSISVAAGQMASVIFAVSCPTPPGSILVSASTTGEDLDADGFMVVVDGGPPAAIGINGSMTATGLAPGDYTVELQDLAFNCSVNGSNPRQVTVNPDAETSVPFDLTCRYHLYDRIAYVSLTPTEMMLHSVDPQAPRVVRSLGIEGEHPAVSPDGLRIAYDWNQDIWTANADGSGALNLTNSAQSEEFPAWSPDGSRLVFSRDYVLWTMDADGSNQASLGIDGWAPTWSPDESQISYTSAQGVSSNEIWVVNADGSGPPLNVTNHPEWDAHPAWSPLGDRIAFSTARDTHTDVYSVHPTGGFVIDMTGATVTRASSPTWSPGAEAIAFQSDGGGNEDIMYYEQGWDIPVLLTDSAAQDIQPSWGGGN